MIAALAIARRLWPVLAIAASAVLALWAAYSWAHGRGVSTERAKWQLAEQRAVAASAALTAALQSQVDAAGAALSERQTEIERLSRLAAAKRSNFYVTHPAADSTCLHPDRLRAIQAGDDAANAANTAR